MARRRSPRRLEPLPRSRPTGRRRAGPARAPIEVDPRVARRVARYRLAPRQLRWRCDPAWFDFRNTREVVPHRPTAFIGQEKALETLRMGLRLESPGYNLFLCGLEGTQKAARIEELVRRTLRQRRRVPDRVYVHDFDDPQRPRLLELPEGKGRRLEEGVEKILARLHEELEGLPVRRWRSTAREIVDEHLPALRRLSRAAAYRRWLDTWRRRLLRDIRTAVRDEFEVRSLGQPSPRGGVRTVVETHPTHANLFGWIGRRGHGEQPPRPHFTEIHRGAFLEADGGVLIVDANDLCASPGAWSTLKSCLKYGALEIQEGDPSAPARSGVLKPEPIRLRVKVVLIGDYGLYDHLYENDPDFPDIFKLRVDFQPEMPLTARVLRRDYPAFIAQACHEEGLRPLSPSGMARLVEYAVRNAGRRNKILAESSVIVDLLREADYWAGRSSRRAIIAADVDRAVREAVDRLNLLERKIAEMIAEGTILISTHGSRVGQVNGLAIYDMGDYSFGKPSRITCETSVGQGGIVNIERESGFSGRSHDKGVQILSGYLRSLFAQNRPLNLTASVCFEQSYSGIDGDSASATEIYSILSSLAGVPIRQDIAVTGSLSQKGDVQPIGGVNEKIEGFFDCIRAGRFTGQEGVIIPRKNIEDLMLREDVVRAVERGEFHLYAIDGIAQGLEILTGLPAGRRRKDGTWTPGSVFARVDARIEELAGHLRRYGEGGDE